MEHVDVVIVGSSIAGSMTAAYLKQQQPNLQVVVLGPSPEHEQRPYVGESLVEPAAPFMQEIGMGDYLRSTQITKNGLTFYHKIKPDDPLDRRYSVHAPSWLYHRAWQLHRPDVDRAVRARAAELGARLVTGRMHDCEIGTAASGHRVHARVGESPLTFACRWLIDATGRTRRIGKRVTTYTRPHAKQRSCFWFWLADFEPFLPHLEMAMRRPPPTQSVGVNPPLFGSGLLDLGHPSRQPQLATLDQYGAHVPARCLPPPPDAESRRLSHRSRSTAPGTRDDGPFWASA